MKDAHGTVWEEPGHAYPLGVQRQQGSGRLPRTGAATNAEIERAYALASASCVGLDAFAAVIVPGKSVRMAWMLWALALVGLAGVHRLYLGRTATGLLWLFTWGLFGIGLVFDALTMRSQVLRANGWASLGRTWS